MIGECEGGSRVVTDELAGRRAGVTAREWGGHICWRERRGRRVACVHS